MTAITADQQRIEAAATSVPEECKADIERLIAMGDRGGDDVQGHIFPLVAGAVAIGLAACSLPDLHEEGPTVGEIIQQHLDTIKQIQERYRR